MNLAIVLLIAALGPPAKAELRAIHRAGQTFVVFPEVDGLIENKQVTRGELKAVLARLQQTRQARYRVYYHSAPITAATLNMDEVVIERFAVEPGKPLPPGVGLYVHSPKKAGKAYYAVTLTVDGREDPATLKALARPVAETVGPGEPVLQGEADAQFAPRLAGPSRWASRTVWLSPTARWGSVESRRAARQSFPTLRSRRRC